MLTLYQPRRSQSEEANTSESETIIRAGRPYLTKVNGKLVLAREKRRKPASIAIDLLGEAFGGNTRVIRRRAKSLDKPKAPLLIDGIPYVSQHQQQLIYTTPLPQQGFAPSVASIAQHKQRYQHPPAFTVLNPTKEDFEQLKLIDAHFNKVVKEKNTSPREVYDREGMALRTTIQITKHICANCGRLRSKKYHHDNPINPGSNPSPAFCRKCQRDASCTSSSDSYRRHQNSKRRKMKKAKRKKQKKKSIENSSESESTVLPGPVAKPALKTEAPRRISSEDHITVEEDYPSEEEEQGRRGRPYGRARDQAIVEEYEDHRRHLPPLIGQFSRATSRSAGRLERYNILRGASRGRRVHEHLPPRPPSPQYRYVQAPIPAKHAEIAEETYPRKVPIYFEEDGNIHRTSAPSRSSLGDCEEPSQRNCHDRNDPTEQRLPSRVSTVVEDEYEPLFPSRRNSRESTHFVVRRPLSKEGSFDDRETISSLQSREAAQRRRRERASPIESTGHPWEQPYFINPRHNDEVVVATERYEYRPRSALMLDEVERRRQEYLDRKMLDTRRPKAEFSEKEEAARYYNQDWPRNEYIKTELRRRGCQRDGQQDSGLVESETRYQYSQASQHNPSRAPKTQSLTTTSNTQNRQDGPLCPLGSDSEVHQRLLKARNKKAIPRDASSESAIKRCQSVSIPCSTLVREATDNRTDNVPIPSSRQATEKEIRSEGYEVEEVEGSLVSGLTEKEREAEAEAESRHVTFRDDMSQRSTGEGWTIIESVRAGSENREKGDWDAGSSAAW